MSTTTVKKILVCEDEDSIRSFVVVNLQRAGYTVYEAGSGEEALRLIEQDPAMDIALLDVMLPGIDGFETCHRLRQANGTMGIIMLTALAQEAEKVNGLQMGADDYVTKPFGTAELIARVDALYRRLSSVRQEPAAYLEQIQRGELTLNLRTRQLLVRGAAVELTHVEYQLMEYFFRHPGTPVSRTELLHAVWGADYYGDDKIVDVNVRRLRMKVESDPSQPQLIQTVWGRGYQWNG